jgi:short-subunit dehydrogenase
MNQYTLITGAGSGIGKELAHIAARERQNLVLVARSKSALLQLQKELIKNNKITVEVLVLDLTKSRTCTEIATFCESKNINITTLINNAGFGDYGLFSQSNLKTQLGIIDVNIRALTELTHLFLPNMIAQKQGKIMNVGSVASFLPGPLMSVYFASKNYVLSFSRALSEELKGTGVSVTCLCPGPTKTKFGNSAQVSETHSTTNPKTTAREVAEYGWYAMQSGETVAIHGKGNRASVQLIKFIPRNLLTALVKRVQK